MPGSDLSDSTMFDLLSTTRRRHVVDLVATRDAPLTRAELLEELSERSAVDDVDAGGGTSVRLYHVDLPKLHEHGVVEFDPEADRIRPTEQTPAVKRCLEQFGT